jgi:hypothetical protein
MNCPESACKSTSSASVVEIGKSVPTNPRPAKHKIACKPVPRNACINKSYGKRFCAALRVAQARFKRDKVSLRSSFGGQRSIQLSHGCGTVRVAGWHGVGNGPAGLRGWGTKPWSPAGGPMAVGATSHANPGVRCRRFSWTTRRAAAIGLQNGSYPRGRGAASPGLTRASTRDRLGRLAMSRIEFSVDRSVRR